MAGNAQDELTDEEHDNPWTQPLFIASAIVVAIVITLGLVLAFTGGDTNNGPRPAQRPPAEMAAPDPIGTSSQNSGCDLPPGDQTPPTQPPPETRWELVGRMVAPTAPRTHGPRIRAHGIRTCFARSPLGALYASVNVVATASEPSRWRELLRELAAKGPGRDRALKRLANESAAPDSSTKMQVAGFSFTTYERDAAVISLAFRVDTGGTAFSAHLPMSMKWEDEDWKVVIPDNGDPFAGLGRIPNLDGYVAWSGA